MTIEIKHENDALYGYINGEQKYSAVQNDENAAELRQFIEYLNLCADWLDNRNVSKVVEAVRSEGAYVQVDGNSVYIEGWVNPVRLAESLKNENQ